MKKTTLIFACVASLIATSCNNLEEQDLTTNEVESIRATIKDFKYNEIDFSRTSISVDEGGPHYAWAATDTIGIFPSDGRQVEFSMASGAGSTSATFTGGGWGLKSTSTYAAYFPLIGKYYLNKTQIPVDYSGQVQNGNASTAHLGNYDYLVAPASEAINGIVTFDFNRLGCLVQLKIDLMGAANLDNVRVEYSDAIFTTTGHVDLTESEPKITPADEKSNFIDVKLNNLSVNAGETAIIYFMMAPANLENKTINVIVTEDNGFSRTFQITGNNFIAGGAYTYSMALSNENVASINVATAGNFATELNKSYRANKITDLKITGSLNGTDIAYLRNNFTILETLDMSEANIVAGGNSYYTNESSVEQTTAANTFPAYFMTGSKLTNLKSIILPNSVTTIPYGSFVDVFEGGDKPKSTYQLTKVVLGENLTTIGELVFACSMKTIHIPSKVNNIGTAAFGYCPNLETITVDSKNTTYRAYDGVLYNKDSYGTYAGYLYCCPPGKTSIEFPTDMTVKGISMRGFSDCVHLTELVIPEGVTSIGSSAFARCTSLRTLTIPSTMKSTSNPFYKNSAMEELHLNHTTPPSRFCTTGSGVSDLPTTCKLYVPNSTGWKTSNTNLNAWDEYFTIVVKYDN